MPIICSRVILKEVWHSLSFTRELHVESLAGTGKVRQSLTRLDPDDGKYPADRLSAQSSSGATFPFTETEQRKFASAQVHSVVRPDKIVNVTVPDDTPALSSPYCAPGAESRESIQMQALIATIGEKLGMSIWLPKADRKAVLKEWSAVMVF